MNPRPILFLCALALALAVAAAAAPRASAYIDISPTLGMIIRESRNIALVKVDKASREKRVVIYTKLADLKGHLPDDQPIRHQLTDGHPPREPRHILDWAAPGQTAVVFNYRNTVLVCIGHTWYDAHRATTGPSDDEDPRVAGGAASAALSPWWRMALDRPELALVYCGSTAKLAKHVTDILAGKRVIITTVAHGAQGRGSFSDCVFNDLQAGAFPPLQRLHASLQMPRLVYDIDPTSSPWFVGLGALIEADVPERITALEARDVSARIDALTDLAGLAGAAESALPAIRKLLSDADPAVRLNAAVAVARIDPSDARAMQSLVAGLADPAATTRRLAAQCLARLGRAAKPALGPLLKLVTQPDPDENVRAAAIDAVGRLGPGAAGAIPQLVKLLDDRSLRCTAAESLGRIGPAAADALPILAKALSDSGDATWQWSAARAMVLIGGEGARPAVPFFTQRLVKAPRGRELYQLTWLLGLLGPLARDALPHMRDAQRRDNELAAMAVWAIAPEDDYPWQIGYHWDRPCDLWLFADYIDRMGDRATPAAATLARRVLDGTAGRVPPWGFHLLKARPDAALPILKEGLEHEDPRVRQRAQSAINAM